MADIDLCDYTSKAEKQSSDWNVKKLKLDPANVDYDASYAFDTIKIMDFVTKLKSENARITVAIHINMKAANAMVERFFSIVGLEANTRNMNLKDTNIEMRALVKANLALLIQRLNCSLPELFETRLEVPWRSGIHSSI
jgi:hypothetical protein